jgi:hypothetical protein
MAFPTVHPSMSLIETDAVRNSEKEKPEIWQVEIVCSFRDKKRLFGGFWVAHLMGAVNGSG